MIKLGSLLSLMGDFQIVRIIMGGTYIECMKKYFPIRLYYDKQVTKLESAFNGYDKLIIYLKEE